MLCCAFQQLPYHGGYTRERIHAFALDEFCGCCCVPAIHQNELRAECRAEVQATQSTDVKKGKGLQRHALRRRSGWRCDRHALHRQTRDFLRKRTRQQRIRNVGDVVAMCANCAFGEAGGAGGVEHGGVVVGCD